MFNRCIFMGRLVADPEFRQTQSGTPVCRFRIAVNRPKSKDGNQDADFIGCTAWRGTAEFVARYFSKGKMIHVEGQLRNNNYTDNNGVKHYSMDVLAENVAFCGGKNEDGQQNNQNAGQPQQNRQTSAPARTQQQQAAPVQQSLDIDDLGEFEEILSDGEDPF